MFQVRITQNGRSFIASYETAQMARYVAERIGINATAEYLGKAK